MKPRLDHSRRGFPYLNTRGLVYFMAGLDFLWVAPVTGAFARSRTVVSKSYPLAPPLVKGGALTSLRPGILTRRWPGAVIVEVTKG